MGEPSVAKDVLPATAAARVELRIVCCCLWRAAAEAASRKRPYAEPTPPAKLLAFPNVADELRPLVAGIALAERETPPRGVTAPLPAIAGIVGIAAIELLRDWCCSRALSNSITALC
jgi:hypothetical protein